jgi:cephalosporin hydroxylase
MSNWTLYEKLKSHIKNLGDPAFWSMSRRELRRLLTRHPSGHSIDILAITKCYRGHGWYKRLGAYQDDVEFAQLADWASALPLETVIEIGTASGGTLLLWARIARRQVVSIDLPGGIHGGGYAEQKGRLFYELVHGRPGVRMDLVRASSQDPQTKKRVLSLLGGRSVDLLFIDGDHRLDGVTADFELWRGLVRPGGHIVFHDIVPHAQIPSCQVHVLWEKLKREYPQHSWEIVSSSEKGWGGIGILSVA